MSRFISMTTLAACALAWLAASPAQARTRHTRHRMVRADSAPPAVPVRPFAFYPRDVEGGVSGNLPFNNQIRKHTDPINANGGR